MRQFTRLFKAMLALGLEPKSHLLAMFAVVKSAASASKDPAVAQALLVIEKFINVAAELPKPKDDDDDDDEQTKLPTTAKPGEAPKSAETPAPAREVDLREGNRG